MPDLLPMTGLSKSVQRLNFKAEMCFIRNWMVVTQVSGYKGKTQNNVSNDGLPPNMQLLFLRLYVVWLCDHWFINQDFSQLLDE